MTTQVTHGHVDPLASRVAAGVAASVKADTDYILLGGDGDTWEVLARVAARSPQAAVKSYVERISGDGDSPQYLRYVATPARSWNPVTVAKKVETTFVIEEAS